MGPAIFLFSQKSSLSPFLFLLLMLQDVDQFSEWITDIGSAHSPRLSRRAVFDGDTGFSDSRESLFNIIYFNRNIRDSRARSSFGITLT
jgi:hypothetical protein